MLEVYPIQTKEEQKNFCYRCCVEFIDDALCYRAKSNGNDIGICQFKLDSQGGHIFGFGVIDKTADNSEPLFVMARAALNFIDLCGVHFATYEGEVTALCDDKLLRRIGFKLDDNNKYTINLTDFFIEPCKHS